MTYFTISKKIVLEQVKKCYKIADLVSYSSKTNPDVTKILEREINNCQFSIHFENELKNISDKSRVLFLAQGWNKETIEKLIKQGIKSFVVDNEQDLDSLLEYLKETNVKIKLMLRTKVKENTIRTEKYYVFGMPTEIVTKKILELKDNKNIESIGIHFHKKTQNIAEWNLKYEIEQMFSQEVLNTISKFNIGGGLPSEYANTNIKIIDGIFKKMLELKNFLNKKNISLMIEPGRFISAPAGKLHTKIIAVHENTLIVDASVYNSDMDALIVPVKLLVEGEVHKGKGKPFVIKGKTPCSMDLFRYRVYLKDPKQGDELVFLNAGAYNFTTDFCDLEKIKTQIID